MECAGARSFKRFCYERWQAIRLRMFWRRWKLKVRTIFQLEYIKAKLFSTSNFCYSIWIYKITYVNIKCKFRIFVILARKNLDFFNWPLDLNWLKKHISIHFCLIKWGGDESAVKRILDKIEVSEATGNSSMLMSIKIKNIKIEVNNELVWYERHESLVLKSNSAEFIVMFE